jgi:hypothetical protein
VLGLGYTTPDGQQGGLNVRQRLQDDDTLLVTLELEQPVVFKLVRLKPGGLGRK